MLKSGGWVRLAREREFKVCTESWYSNNSGICMRSKIYISSKTAKDLKHHCSHFSLQHKNTIQVDY